jgi:hypothetical protein
VHWIWLAVVLKDFMGDDDAKQSRFLAPLPVAFD